MMKKGSIIFKADIQVIKRLCIPKMPTEGEQAERGPVMHTSMRGVLSLGCELDSLGS